MAKLLLIIVVYGMVTIIVSGAGDKKGAALKVSAYTAECQPTVSFSASKSESDCSAKCRKDTNCRFAVYQGKEKKCGLVPASSQCTFNTDFAVNAILGFNYKKFTKHDDSRPTDWDDLTTKTGARLLSGAAATTGDGCRDLCDIIPQCVMVLLESARGQQHCNVMGKKSSFKKPTNTDETYTVYIAA